MDICQYPEVYRGDSHHLLEGLSIWVVFPQMELLTQQKLTARLDPEFRPD